MDEQTDRIAISISRVSSRMLAGDKNVFKAIRLRPTRLFIMNTVFIVKVTNREILWKLERDVMHTQTYNFGTFLACVRCVRLNGNQGLDLQNFLRFI